MKVITVLGTRPEIIRLSSLIPVLDGNCDHLLVHTGQNFDAGLTEVFFSELGVRPPDINLGIRGSFGTQVGNLLTRIEAIFHEHRPERLVILGDTNSGLAAIIAKRLGIAVYHLEAGNRCYDDRVPEEVNRRIIDHCSTILMPYTERSRANLLREGFASDRVYTTGNPIKQVLDRFADQIGSSDILRRLGLKAKEFFLVTMHRAENVDTKHRLSQIVDALAMVASQYGYPVVCSVHPRTDSRLKEFGIETKRNGLQMLRPMGFVDFVALERAAFCCLSDSGTVQEETCIFGVPNVTIRDVTERPETVECGSNFIAGTETDSIVEAVRFVTTRESAWRPPREYLAPNVAEVCARIILAHRVHALVEEEWLAATNLS